MVTVNSLSSGRCCCRRRLVVALTSILIPASRLLSPSLRHSKIRLLLLLMPLLLRRLWRRRGRQRPTKSTATPNDRF